MAEEYRIMGNVLIEGAIDGLRLIGIDVPSSAENFIEMLVNAGVDVVSEVPRIISFIEQLGSEAWSTIEQVATGMEQYGPVGYIEHLMDQAYEPHYQTVKSIHMQKQVMLNAHRTALTNFQTQVQALSRGSQSFTGQATTSSSDKLTMLTTNMSSHLDLLETSLTYDQQFFDDYSSAKADIANTVILELVFIGVFCVVVLLAPETVLVAAGGFAIALSSVELALLAAIATTFVTWGIQHELLAHPITLDWNPPSTTTNQPLVITDINGGANNGGETVITNGDGTNADAGGLSVADQEDWALDGAKKCAKARSDYIRQTGNGNINYAIGFLLQPKYTKPPEPYGPILGKGPDQSGHSEQKIVDYWSTKRIPQLRGLVLQSGDHLVLFIFSRNNVCPECQSMVPTWRTVLATAAGPGVTVHFYLWESVDPYSPVGPDNLQLAPVSS